MFRRTALFGLVLSIVLGAQLAEVPSARAAQDKPASAQPDAAPTAEGIVVADEDVTAARDFWSEDRMAAAKPETNGGSPDHNTVAAQGEPQYEIYKEGYMPAGSYSSAVGRLYFRTSDGTSTCSATVVAKDLVLTAGHCVTSDEGDYGNFMFVPAQQGSNAPYGIWYASNAVYYRYYRTHNAFYPLDYAFLRFSPQGGEHIGDVTGEYPIAYNVSDGDKISVGYPAEGDYFGENCAGVSCYQFFCYSPVGDYATYGDGWYEVGIGCHSSGGHSGGPMFQDIDGKRYVTSVNSNGPTLERDDNGERRYLKNVWGPYFNHAVSDLYDSAEALA